MPDFSAYSPTPISMRDWPNSDNVADLIARVLSAAGVPLDNRIDIQYWEDDSSTDYWDITYNHGHDQPTDILIRFKLTNILEFHHQILSEHPLCPYLTNRVIHALAQLKNALGDPGPTWDTYTTWAIANAYPETMQQDMVLARLAVEKEKWQFKFPVLGRVYEAEGI
jgi:hypothetical protein